MRIVSKLIQLAILALFTAFYRVLVESSYVAWLESQGKIYGVVESLLGYFLLFVVGWLAGIVVVKRMRQED